MTREEEKDYAIKSANGDLYARNKLIESNLRFVVEVAKWYQNRGLPLEDLISEGNLGLMNAVDKFQVDKGYHLVSYAVWWIRQRILLALDNQTKLIRIPTNKLVALRKVNKIMNSENEYNEKITEVNKLVKELHLNDEILRELTNISKDPISLDTKVYSDKYASFSLVDTVEAEDYKLPDETAIENLVGDDITTCLNEFLNPIEKKVIEYNFGLGGKSKCTLDEIGKEYNLSKERIRQIKVSALRKLGKGKAKLILKDYLTK